MKNILRTNEAKRRDFLAIIAFVTVLGFSFTACDHGNGGGRDDRTIPSDDGGGGGNSREIDSKLLKMTQIPAGAFMMGSPATDSFISIGETQHQVRLTEGFSIGKYQVTQAQWIAVMGAGEDRTAAYYGKGDNYPVYNVSWYDAVEFCNKLSVKKRLAPVYSLHGSTNPAEWGAKGEAWNSIEMDITKNGYRLPTEAEWEYACRGNYPNKATETNTKPFGIGDGTKMVSGMANFDVSYPYDLNHVPAWGYIDTKAAGNVGRTTEVGSYAPNNYDIYDMHGNVWEWCWDWYSSNYYLTSPQSDPTGPDAGSCRVIRGGYWYDIGQVLRSANRHNYDPSYQGVGIGIRLARSYADSIEDIELDDWTWNAYSDRKDGGKSSVSIKQGAGDDSNKINASGKTENNPGGTNGYAGCSAVPNADNLASLKAADSFSFKSKGDGKQYVAKVITSDIEDGAYFQYQFTADPTEKTVEIPYSDLKQPDWGIPKDFNKNNITQIEFHAATEVTGVGPFNVTIGDLKINGGSASSVDDYSDLEPSMNPNSNRAVARVGGTTKIGIPNSLPAGPAVFSIHPDDTSIASITPDGTLTGLGLGTARVIVTVGSQSATVLVSVSPSEPSYKLPESAGKKLGDYSTWDNGDGNRPGALPADYANYIAEPTTQLAWYWKNPNGIDFLAYYVDPANNSTRGWVRTTFSFGGWRYNLNGATGNMTDGVQSNGNVRLVLKPEFVYDNGTPYLQITHTLTNTGSVRLTGQKFGASADIMLHGNDHAPLTYLDYGALMTNALVSPSIKFRLVCQNVQGVNNVSTLWMGRYGNELENVYVDKRENITGQDSAMNFSYQNIDLKPGESKTFVVRFTQIQ